MGGSEGGEGERKGEERRGEERKVETTFHQFHVHAPAPLSFPPSRIAGSKFIWGMVSAVGSPTRVRVKGCVQVRVGYSIIFSLFCRVRVVS